MSSHIPSTSLVTATEDIRKSAGAWIASADLKATAILTAACAVPALAALTGLKSTSVSTMVALFLFCLFDAASIVMSALVLYPRTDRARVLRAKGVADPLPRSLTFFGDLSSLGHYELKTLIEHSSNAMREKDAMEQTLIVAWIATRKMQFMRCAVVCLASAAIALVTMVSISMASTSQVQGTTPFRVTV